MEQKWRAAQGDCTKMMTQEVTQEMVAALQSGKKGEKQEIFMKYMTLGQDMFTNTTFEQEFAQVTSQIT